MTATAIILAAGRGSRLHPYTASCPKCLTELGGRTLLNYQIGTLQTCGITNIVVVTGYLGEMLESPGWDCVENPLWAETNMVESLFSAESKFTSDIIVAYSDIVYEPRVLQALLDSEADISVIVDRQWRALWEQRFADPLSDAETLRIDRNGDILEIGQRPESYDRIEAQYIGLMRFKGQGVAALRKGYTALRDADLSGRTAAQAYMTDLLSELISAKHRLRAVPVDGGWLEVDTVEDYELYAAKLADGTITEFFDTTRQN